MLQVEDKKSWDAGLKHKERLFVLHFCTDDLTFLNATASYKAVYKDRDKKTGTVKDRTNEVCQANSSRLMSRDHIKLAVAKLLKETQADLDEKNGYKLLKDLMLLADYNPADIIDRDGRLKVKSFNELGELAKCVSQIEKTKDGLKVILVDRSKYMNMYLKYLNLIKPEIVVDEQLKVVAMVQKADSADDWNKIAEGANG
ncbi:MAG: terminase small subunit [Spirochaetaceae bacterium]|nr:terminase small subunit [Spirochaetaceae bacterium]MBO7731548.1 terminase small subunit [Methanobrevibacter sp.]